jgi:2-hydroxychromene-2-carboxylate isomerase
VTGRGSPAPALVLYYDLGSPYAYLASARVESLLGSEATRLEWRPVLLGGLYKRFGGGSWALTAAREAGLAEIERRAARYGLPPARWPEPFPGDMLAAMRAATAAAAQGRLGEFTRAAYRRQFAEGIDLSAADAVLDVGEECGLDRAWLAAAMADPAVKLRLRQATDDAGDRGVRGVPTLRVGDRVFWGDDRLEEAVGYARGAPAPASRSPS